MNYDIRNLICKLKEDKSLTKDILHKMVFLIDWKYTLVNDEQLTNVKWFKDSNGANFILDGKDCSYYLDNVTKNDLSIGEPLSQLDDIKISIFIDFIKEKYERMLYTDFTQMYFSTYPINYTTKKETMDLIKSRELYVDFLLENKESIKNFNEIFLIKVNKEKFNFLNLDKESLSKDDLNNLLEIEKNDLSFE